MVPLDALIELDMHTGKMDIRRKQNTISMNKLEFVTEVIELGRRL